MRVFGKGYGMKKEKLPQVRKHYLLIGISLVVYAYFGLAWIRLPGPQQDELIFLNTILTARVGDAYAGRFRIFKTNIPTMVSEYVGGLKGWIWSGIFSVWKPTI